MMAKKTENVAVFNPLVLALPDWHPDGPDGDVDGYVIPFVMPPGTDGKQSWQNRLARIRVAPGDHGWRANLRNCYDHAETADQARAFAGAWLRAAEVLENVMAPRPEAIDDDVVDAEVVEDDEDQDDEPKWNRRLCCPSDLSAPHVPGCTFEPREDQPIDYSGPAVVLPPPPKHTGCPACAAGSCTLHTWANAPDNPDGSCAGCNVEIDGEHRRECPVYRTRLRQP